MTAIRGTSKGYRRMLGTGGLCVTVVILNLGAEKFASKVLNECAVVVRIGV